jgi:hypothetical protein
MLKRGKVRAASARPFSATECASRFARFYPHFSRLPLSDQINARKADVRRAVGEVTLDLVLTSVADATLEKVLDEVLKVIPADDSGGKCDNDGR